MIILLLLCLLQWGYCAELIVEVRGQVDGECDWVLVLPQKWAIETNEIKQGDSAARVTRNLHEALESDESFVDSDCSTEADRTIWVIDCPFSFYGDLQIGCKGDSSTLRRGLEVHGVEFVDVAEVDGSTTEPTPTSPSASTLTEIVTEIATEIVTENETENETENMTENVAESESFLDETPLAAETSDESDKLPDLPVPSVTGFQMPSPTQADFPAIPIPPPPPDSPTPTVESTESVTPTEIDDDERDNGRNGVPPTEVFPPTKVPTSTPTDTPQSPQSTDSPSITSPPELEEEEGEEEEEETLISEPIIIPQIEVTELELTKENSLMFRIDFRVDKTTQLFAEYYPVDEDAHPEIPRLRSPISDASRRHRLWFYRLYEIVEYQFDVYQVGSDEIEYTGSFRTDYVDLDVFNKKPEIIHGTPTYDMVYTARDEPGFHFVYDSQGEIVWYLDHRSFPGDNMQRKSNNNTVLIGRRGTIIEISANGRIISEVDTECFVCHHSLAIDTENENIIYTTARERIPFDDESIAEYDFEFDQGDDTVLKVDLEAGTYEVLIRMREQLDIFEDRTQFSNQDNDARLVFPCNQNGSFHDWIRLNTVAYINSTYILVGSHHLQEIYGFVKVSEGSTTPTTTPTDLILSEEGGQIETDESWELAWRMSAMNEKSNFSFKKRGDRFYGQHEISVLPNGNFLLFDNGIGRPPGEGDWYSRGIEYRPNYETMEIRSIWQFSLNISNHVVFDEWDNDVWFWNDNNEEELCTGLHVPCIAVHRGSLQRLENGNTIVVFISCECDPSERGYIAEVDKDENLVSLVAIGSPEENWHLDSGIISSIGGETIVDRGGDGV